MKIKKIKTVMQIGVTATQFITKGEVVLSIKGEVTERANRYTVQISEDKHIDLPENFEEHPDDFLWMYTNHSCDPNIYIEDREFIALKSIKTGDPITFDYETNEAEMAEPFNCQCGSINCRDLIKGYDYLSRESIKELTAPISPHLLTRALVKV